MSYEPHLLIDAKQLLRLTNSTKFIQSECDGTNADVIKEIREVSHYEPITYRGHKIIIAYPELSLHNQRVREYLNENNVYYITSY